MPLSQWETRCNHAHQQGFLLQRKREFKECTEKPLVLFINSINSKALQKFIGRPEEHI